MYINSLGVYFHMGALHGETVVHVHSGKGASCIHRIQAFQQHRTTSAFLPLVSSAGGKSVPAGICVSGYCPVSGPWMSSCMSVSGNKGQKQQIRFSAWLMIENKITHNY